MLKLKTFTYPVQAFSANTYLLIDELNNCIVIDPGQKGHELRDHLLASGLNVKAILLTHTHFDHMRGVMSLVEQFDCDVYAHHIDVLLFQNPEFNRYCPTDEPLVLPDNIKFVEDNENLKLLDAEIKVLHTPFHTKGSVIYLIPGLNIVFTGDTLFKGSIGRSDLFGSDPFVIADSLRIFKSLPKSLIVLPGHGEMTTLEEELAENLYLVYA